MHDPEANVSPPGQAVYVATVLLAAAALLAVVIRRLIGWLSID